MQSIKFLGTGTSLGTPIIGCKCNVCTSDDSRDMRLRSSVLLSVGCKNILIDAGPDLRYQMLRSGTLQIDALLVTHEHKDHIGGIDDLRPFNYIQNKDIPVYAEKRVCEAIKREFSYVFEENPYPGVPKINLHTITEAPFSIEDTTVTPIRGMHRELPVLGFRVGDICYLTDMNYICAREQSKIAGTTILVINALRIHQHYSHFHLQAALDIIARIQPTKAYLTHISHEMGTYAESSRNLPPKCIFCIRWIGNYSIR